MATALLTERFAFTSGTVGGTAEAPVVENVLACGPVSENRRRYLVQAFAGDRIKRYIGAPVFSNHGKDRDGRTYQEQIGIIADARHRGDGMPLIDIAVNPEKELGRAFLWDARHQPKACGMSHVAHCETARAADGWDEVTELVKVESVDVISAGNAATTKGLYESTKGRTVAALMVRAITESLVKHPKVGSKVALRLKRLGEMDGMDAVPTTMDAAPADDAEPDDAVMAAFKAAIADVVDKAMSGDLDPKAALTKIKSLLTSHAGLNDDGTPDKDGDPKTPDDAATEAKKKAAWGGAILEALDACDKAKFTPSPEDRELIAAAPADRRPALIERLKKTTEAKPAGQSPSGASRRPGAGSAGHQPVTEATKPAAAPAEPPKIVPFSKL